MRGEPELADARIVDQARLHHVPAHGALGADQQRNAEQAPQQRTTQHTTPGEPQQRQQHAESDQSSQQSVRPFPPENRFELFQRHAEVHLQVFRAALIEREGA